MVIRREYTRTEAEGGDDGRKESGDGRESTVGSEVDEASEVDLMV